MWLRSDTLLPTSEQRYGGKQSGGFICREKPRKPVITLSPLAFATHESVGAQPLRLVLHQAKTSVLCQNLGVHAGWMAIFAPPSIRAAFHYGCFAVIVVALRAQKHSSATPI